MWPFRRRAKGEARPSRPAAAPMISYAQNYEDVVARRALGDPAEGFYVDVGAADPVKNNATYYFYERGWSGVNVEPDTAFFQRLNEARPRDTNLNVAVSSRAGRADLIRVSGEEELNTLVEPVAEQYAGQFALERVAVEAVPLEAILAEHASGSIDLLKIDVEGGEEDVLRSFDLARWSPRLLVVEATWPGTPRPSHEGWEPLILEAGYRLGLFDGLNRFYARAEDRQTLERLRVPANLFDQFVQYQWWQLLTPEAQERLAAAGYPDPPRLG